MKKSIIIIGGGYGGAGLAKALDRNLDVTLVEPREAFVHNIGAMRSVVDPGLLERILIPYDRLLENGKIIQQSAVKLSANEVTLANGDAITSDYIAVATGSNHRLPFKPLGDSAGDFANSVKDANQRLLGAERVAIIGGGPVGVELAGEIANAHPDKKITLVSRGASLCEGFNPKLGEKLEAGLKNIGVTLYLKCSPTNLPDEQGPFGPAELALDNGETVSADMVFLATGARVYNDLLATLGQVSFDPQNRAIVDNQLRLTEYPNIYAFGDCAATGDPMTAVAITQHQQGFLEKAITRSAAGKSFDKAYVPWKAQALFVPIGPKGGASVLPLGSKGVVVGALATSLGKGRDLLIKTSRKLMGYQ